MKDYSELENVENNVKEWIKLTYDRGYNVGWEDAVNSHELMTEEEWKVRQKQDADEIKVGDEVTNGDIKGIVTMIDDGFITIICPDGSCGDWQSEKWKRTGRHFDQIGKVLEQMKD